MRSLHPENRRLLALVAAFICAGLTFGCSSDGGSDWSAILKMAQSTWDSRDAAADLNDVAAIPYATLGVRLDGGREQILVLATDSNGDRLWTSSARVALETHNGRIVRTAGFGTDMTGSSTSEAEPEDWTKPHPYTWVGDFADLGKYSVPVNCEVRPIGADPVLILGKQIDTFRVDESCRSQGVDWSYTNSYWISVRSGRVWRAIEHFHPKGPTIEIELLRPPLSAD